MPLRKSKTNLCLLIITIFSLYLLSLDVLSYRAASLAHKKDHKELSSKPLLQDDVIKLRKGDIDVVIAFCKEPEEKLQSLIRNLKILKKFRDYKVNILLYYKCGLPKTRKGETWKGLELFELDNMGRESATYLHHIIKNYRSLSQWTLFLQAVPHCQEGTKIDLVIPMLERHFEPNLGMLQLSLLYECQCGFMCKSNGDFSQVRDIFTLFRRSFCTGTYTVWI
jgi:hypothetical protein